MFRILAVVEHGPADTARHGNGFETGNKFLKRSKIFSNLLQKQSFGRAYGRPSFELFEEDFMISHSVMLIRQSSLKQCQLVSVFFILRKLPDAIYDMV